MAINVSRAAIVLVKEFTYRGKAEEWSNRYTISGTIPTTDAGWEALGKAIWESERTFITTRTKLVTIYGYATGQAASVASINIRTQNYPFGTGQDTYNAGTAMAGDQAAMLRAYVRRSSTGKKVYLRKYYHDVSINNADPDQINTVIKGYITAHGAKMLDGSLPGGVKWISPGGLDASAPEADAYVTTRTLKRRGKRPLPLP
jgi:hypothetical protein